MQKDGGKTSLRFHERMNDQLFLVQVAVAAAMQGKGGPDRFSAKDREFWLHQLSTAKQGVSA